MAHFECMVKAGRRAMASGKLHDVRIAITEVTAPSTSAQWGDDDQIECGSGVTENGQRENVNDPDKCSLRSVCISSTAQLPQKSFRPS